MTPPYFPPGQGGDAAAGAPADDPGASRPSKTQRKKHMHALQELGEALVALPTHVVRAADALPENLREAVLACQRIRGFEARRRQMQYIGKLMRTADAHTVRAVIAEATQDDRAAVARLHAIEHWRERLLADDTALIGFVQRHPQADVQQLRTLIRSARNEAAAGKPPRSSRALFQSIKAALAARSAPAGGAVDEPLPRLD